MIKIELNRLDNDLLMEAVNDMGNKVQMDGSPADGGHDKAFRPMQMLLAAMGGCSTVDVVTILRKQREELKDIKITVTAEREKGVTPSLYTEVHAHFRLYGDIDEDKAQKAVALSVGKYCSVAKTLEKTAKVTFSVEVIR
ncbi:MAG: OsmC family protein [Cyclobacteriaceae bacterium]|jgi:putative redox protein